MKFKPGFFFVCKSNVFTKSDLLITQGLIPRRLRRPVIPAKAGIQKSKLDAGRRSRDQRGSGPA